MNYDVTSILQKMDEGVLHGKNKYLTNNKKKED
jgi:hypothetical protein